MVGVSGGWNSAPSLVSVGGRNSAPSLVSVGGRNSAPSLVSVEGGIVPHHWCQWEE
ncbi:unnamed protein product [Staurois parvus]|uniref:Uncharacterized protein n=1 Tax=Staurois parvus TaxID=386267 RepID=A0ABN9DBZ5_9NEOB|nr:unnamed protein product [Staurois parvus]